MQWSGPRQGSGLFWNWLETDSDPVVLKALFLWLLGLGATLCQQLLVEGADGCVPSLDELSPSFRLLTLCSLGVAFLKVHSDPLLSGWASLDPSPGLSWFPSTCLHPHSYPHPLGRVVAGGGRFTSVGRCCLAPPPLIHAMHKSLLPPALQCPMWDPLTL